MSEDRDFYKELIDNLYDGVYFVDRDRVITYWNKGAERITGYNAGHTIGHSCRENLLNHVTANGVQLCLTNCPLAACMEDGNVREAEVFLHHADGHRLPVVVRAAPLRDDHGEIIGAVETFSNNNNVITARRELREMRFKAFTDHLTNIPNRRYMEGRLRAAIAQYSGLTGGAGLLFIDVDHFKKLNDLHGHEVGDKVLRMVANSLMLNLRATDTVGRWGGEEFLVILHDVQTVEALEQIAAKLSTLVACSRLDLDDQSLCVTISVGATLLRPGDTPEIFVRRADQLMYQSKQAGRNRVTIG